jgi:FO synthase
MARLLLHGRIDNIQTSWVKLGEHGTRLMLTGGANDVGGTLMEETISRMAGAQNGSLKSVRELNDLASGIGRPARQRSTTYGPVCEERVRAAASFDEALRRQLPLTVDA